MITHRQPVVIPQGGDTGMHPSYALHGIAQHYNQQHLAAQQANWDQTMAANPHGHFNRPQYRT